MGLPYAEDVAYWKTSDTWTTDDWLEKTKKLITSRSGKILTEAFISDHGATAYMLEFTLVGDHFKIIWPVLPSRSGNEKAAKKQAVTFMFHDTKAKCVKADVYGARRAFLEYLLLPDGLTVVEHSSQELAELTPAMLRQPSPQLPDGNAVEGEYTEIEG